MDENGNLPCPFCGGEPILNHLEPHSHTLMLDGKPIMPDYPGSWTIECCDVGMIMDTREEVISAWNRRAPAAPQQAPAVDEALISAVKRTREDLGETGSNYPAVRKLLSFAESAIAMLSSKPTADVVPAKSLTDDEIFAHVQCVVIAANQEYTRCNGVIPDWDLGFFAGQLHVFEQYMNADKTAIAEAKDYISKLQKAAAQPAASVPEGFKLVPIEPTPDMLTAGGNDSDFCHACGYDNGPGDCEPIYRNMIVAAPSPDSEKP